MTKEHKKLYKAGKNWVAATITVATIAFIGGAKTDLTAHADTVTNDNPQTQQVVGSSATQPDVKQAVLKPSTTQENLQSQNGTDVNPNSSVNAQAQPSNETVDEHTNSDQTNNEQSVTEIRDVTRTVKMDYFPAIRQTVRFTRSVSTDQSGKKVYGEWKLADGEQPVWPEIDVPKINDRYTDTDRVPQKVVTPDTNNEEVDITYRDVGWDGKPYKITYPKGLTLKTSVETYYRTITSILPDGSKTIYIQKAPESVNDLYDENGNLVAGSDYAVEGFSTMTDWDDYSIPQIPGYKSFVHGYVNEDGLNVAGQYAQKIAGSNFFRNGMTRPVILNVNIDISYVKDHQDSSKTSQNKTVTRNIIIIHPDGTQASQTQKVQLVRSVQADDAGGYIYGEWHVDQHSPKAWSNYSIPQLSGYDSYANGQVENNLPEVSVDGSTNDAFVIITYNRQTKAGTINYVDSNGQVVKTDQISGKVGDKVSVKVSLPDGYELANKDESIPAEITVTEDGIKTITINVKKIDTSLADNEVPYDSSAIHNQVNANHGWLDHYSLTENGQGQAQLIASGWHATGYSNDDRYRYVIVYDDTLGHEIARQKVTPQVRNDVQDAYPNVVNSNYAGFNVVIDIPNYAIGHSLRLISRYSSDPVHGEGHLVDYWYKPFNIDRASHAWLDGLHSDGHTLTVTGWHATNQAATRQYHYIIAWDQRLGHEIARQQVITVNRPDVAKAYPTVFNAINSGFSVNFNLTPEFFNDPIQFISRWTNDPAGNGSASDYWFNAINRDNRAHLDSVNLSSGHLQVAGWHASDLSQLEPNHYLIVFDNTTGKQVAFAKVGLINSPDVQRAFGNIKTADHSRFNFAFVPLNLIAGHNYSLVSRYSADANGNGNDGAHTDYWLNMGQFNQAAHYIDHCFVKGNQLTIDGWMTNDRAISKPYAYAILLQNGQEIGRQQLSLKTRDDVARAFPRVYNSQKSGFSANFTLPQYSLSGLRIVLRFTDDPAGNGNSADEWVGINPIRVY